jgi:F-box interacting protein
VFGLGCDPASNTYKVARYFYRSAVHLQGGHYQYNLGMEVFTIGTEHRWRETATPPASWPVMTRRTATFFKGSLLWTIDESFLGATPGFIRFSLEDESFTAVPPPPCWIPELDYKEFSLAELRGELCLCVHRRPSRTMEMWVCNDLGTSGQTPWERRYVLANVARPLRLLGMFSEEMVFKGAKHISGSLRYHIWFYKQPHGGVFKNVVSMEAIEFHDPHNGKIVRYPRDFLGGWDVIPYVPSLVPL